MSHCNTPLSAFRVGARALRCSCALGLSSLPGFLRQTRTTTKGNKQIPTPPIFYPWNQIWHARNEQKCPLGHDKQQCLSWQIKLFKIAGLKRFVFWKPTQPTSKQKRPTLSQANLTTDPGSKHIKIFYPIICFDQLTTILKIQSWSSWQLQSPNFIEEFFSPLFHFSILLARLLMPRQ